METLIDIEAKGLTTLQQLREVQNWDSRHSKRVSEFASTASTASTSGTIWIELVEAKATSVEAGAFGVEATGSSSKDISTW